MKRVFLCLLFLFVCAACAVKAGKTTLGPAAEPGNVPDLAGKYVVNGIDPAGIEYSGHLQIMPGQKPGTYLMQWIVVGAIQEGVGEVVGNQLVVQWRNVEENRQGTLGNATYTITVDRELSGTRTIQGVKGTGTETAYPND